jgi:hypothetical protein
MLKPIMLEKRALRLNPQPLKALKTLSPHLQRSGIHPDQDWKKTKVRRKVEVEEANKKTIGLAGNQ